MKTIKRLCVISMLIIAVSLSAQTDDKVIKVVPIAEQTNNETIKVTSSEDHSAEEIINNYFLNTGGIEAWKNLQGIKMMASVNFQGMDFPAELYQMKDGRQLFKVNIQGQDLVINSFDGETMWSTSFMTMLPEKSDETATENMRARLQDFPSPFLNYKEKGYTVELIGKEDIEGTEAYKIKLTQKPSIIDGIEVPNISFHYFDALKFVPIVSEAIALDGPMKGKKGSSTFNDYTEVDGLFFPFSISMQGQELLIKDIIVNPEVDNSIFAFPDTKVEDGK